MSEERAHELRISSNLRKLFVNPQPQLFALLQWSSRNSGALDVTPHQLIGIEVWRISGQEMQSQCAFGARDVVLDDGLLMHWQSVDDQMYRLLAIEHQSLGKRHKQLVAEPAFVPCKPEGTLRIDSGRRAHALPLARPLNGRCVTALRPSSAMHRVSSKAQFVPEEDVRVLLTSPLGKPRIRVVPPAINCLGVALVSSLQWLLWRQIQPPQRRADRGHAQRDTELLLRQFANHASRPQPEIKPVLQRILAINPSEHQLFMRARECARASRAFGRA